MCPFLPNPNLPQKIAETDVPRGYIRKINFDVNLPIQTWTPHAYIPTNLSNDLGVVVGGLKLPTFYLFIYLFIY